MSASRQNVRHLVEDPEYTDDEMDDRVCRMPNEHPKHKEKRPRDSPDINKKSNSNEPSQETLMKQILERLDSLEKNKTSNKPYRKQDVVCYNCQELGHYARNCPQKKDDPRGRFNRQTTDKESDTIKPLNYQGPTLAARGRSQY